MANIPPIKKKYIETPEKLWDLFKEYVQHEKDNPMYRIDYVGKDGDKVNTKLDTPITFEGFECWLADQDVIEHLSDYSANKNGVYDAYSTIITRIRQNCFVQNFKGASVGLFNANLIAKKIGLVEKTETNLKVEQEIFKSLELDVHQDNGTGEDSKA
jgi:hypothetical protein